MKTMQQANLRALNSGLPLLLLLVFGTGCPAPTPKERVQQLNGIVTEVGGGVIDLDLSRTSVLDGDMSYVHGFCNNSSAFSRIRMLNLSDTAITDKALEFMSLQKGFSSDQGLEVLILRNTAVTEEAIEEFHNSAPECTIIRN